MEPKQNNWHTIRNWHKSLTKEAVDHAYTIEGASTEDLAVRWGTTNSSVRRLLQRLNIPRRNYKEAGAQHFGNRDPILTESQTQLILGSLLGDACWSVGTMKYRDGSEHETIKVHFYHTEKKLGYTEHKRGLLGQGVRINQPLKLSTRISGHGSIMRGFAFSATRTLKPLVEITGYPKYVNRVWLDHLNWEGLAYWYQDDGSLRDQGRLGSVVFYTNGFTYAEQEVLRDWLKDFAGLTCKINKSPNGTPGEWILTAHRQMEVHHFMTNIKPYIVPCMEHKIRTWTENFQQLRVRVKQLP